MTRHIRPSTPDDGPAIAALLTEAGLNPNVEPAQLHWKYWQERGDWPGARSYVLTNGADIVAHAGIVPGACVWDTERVRVIHLVDWAARKTALGAGVALLKHIGQLTDALVAVGGSEHTLRILPNLGFRTIGNATEYVRDLYSLCHLKRSARPLWKWLPRLVRSLAWTLRVRTSCVNWRARRVELNELHVLSGLLPAPRDGTAVFERNESLLSYFLQCPIASMELYALEHAGRLRGYFLLSFVPREARMADCWIDSEDPSVWRSLIRCAVREVARSDCLTLTTLASEPMLSRCLIYCGFQARRALPVQWLPANGSAIPGGSVHVQMLDYDAAYLYHPKQRMTPAAVLRGDPQARSLAPQS